MRARLSRLARSTGRQHSLPLLWVGVGVLVVLYWRYGTAEITAALTNVHVGYLCLYLLFACAAVLCASLRWMGLARTFAAHLPLRRFVQARVAGDAVGTLIPSGRLAGEPLRVVLTSAPGVETSRITAGVAADRIVEMFIGTLCAMAYVTIFAVTRSDGTSLRSSVVVVAGFAAALVALIVPLVMLRRGMRPLAPLYRWVLHSEEENSWGAVMRRTEDHLAALLREHPGMVGLGLLVSLATETLVIVEYHYLLAAFGVALPLPLLLIVLVGSGVAQLVPTPANLGGLEGMQVAALTLTGGGPALGLLIGTILRVHSTLWILIGIAVLFWRASLRQAFDQAGRSAAAPVSPSARS